MFFKDDMARVEAFGKLVGKPFLYVCGHILCTFIFVFILWYLK
jgi:hypothetical protein